MNVDNYKYKGLRRKLAEQIAGKGISDKRILQAIETIPRHFFLDSVFAEFAYDDKPFQIGCGQTISQPYTVAYQTQLLQVEKGHKVLEIGTGSGYQACVLAELGAKVYTVERIRELYIRTKKFLTDNHFTPKTFYGDGYKGLPGYAPFHRILVTCGAPEIPESLKVQLVIGGILVIPIDVQPGLQVMTSVIRTDEMNYRIESHDHFRFVPMLEDKS